MDARESLPGSPDIGTGDMTYFCQWRHFSIIDDQICAAGNLIEEAYLDDLEGTNPIHGRKGDYHCQPRTRRILKLIPCRRLRLASLPANDCLLRPAVTFLIGVNRHRWCALHDFMS